jgi:hypothetical protein
MDEERIREHQEQTMAASAAAFQAYWDAVGGWGLGSVFTETAQKIWEVAYLAGNIRGLESVITEARDRRGL